MEKDSSLVKNKQEYYYYCSEGDACDRKCACESYSRRARTLLVVSNTKSTDNDNEIEIRQVGEARLSPQNVIERFFVEEEEKEDHARPSLSSFSTIQREQRCVLFYFTLFIFN